MFKSLLNVGLYLFQICEKAWEIMLYLLNPLTD